MVVLQTLSDLADRVRQPRLERISRLRAAALETLLQGADRWWEDKKRVRLRERLQEIFRALDIDVEQRDLARGLNASNLRLGRAIHVLVNLLVLDEIVLVDHLAELILRHVEVIDTVFLALTHRARRVRNTESELAWIFIRQLVDESRFADARGTHNNHRPVAHVQIVVNCRTLKHGGPALLIVLDLHLEHFFAGNVSYFLNQSDVAKHRKSVFIIRRHCIVVIGLYGDSLPTLHRHLHLCLILSEGANALVPVEDGWRQVIFLVLLFFVVSTILLVNVVDSAEAH